MRDGSTGLPIAGAVVSLIPRGKRTNAQPQLTDSKGRFVFVNVTAPNSCHLRAVRPGYLDGAYSHGDSRSELGEQISVQDGDWFSAADIVLWHTAAVTGRVTDERGEPLVGAYVRVLRSHQIAGSRRFVPGLVGRTDDRGIYRIPHLIAGEYVVMVPSVQDTLPVDDLGTIRSGSGSASNAVQLSASGTAALLLGRYPVPSDARHVYPPLFYPGTLSLSEAARVPLKSGEELEGIDLRLHLASAYTVRGTVESGKRAAPVILRLVRKGNEELGLGGDTATTRPNAKGQFEFLHVPVGEYVLEARTTITEYAERPAVSSSFGRSQALPSTAAWRSTFSVDVVSSPSMAVLLSTSSLTTPSQGGGSWARVPVAVADHDVDNVDVTLLQAGELRGTAVFEASADAKVVPRAWQFILEPDAGSADLGMPIGQARRDEPFSIPGVLPGSYFLKADGLQEVLVKSVVWHGKDYTYAAIDVGTGGISDVEVTLTAKSSGVRGVVLAKDAATASTAVVVYFPQNDIEWHRYGLRSQRMGIAYTNGGRYDISRLPAGDYFITAIPANRLLLLDSPGFLKSMVTGAKRVTLEWDAPQSLDLEVQGRSQH